MGRAGRDPSSQSFPSFLIHSSLPSCHSGNCFLICLPVDVLIIYKEPFGMEATMLLIVVAFVPFLVNIFFLHYSFYSPPKHWLMKGNLHKPNWDYYLFLLFL